MKTSFVKHPFDFPMHKCHFCQNKPEGILTLKDHSEIRVCLLCATPKVKRLRRKVKKILIGKELTQSKTIQTKISENSFVDSIKIPNPEIKRENEVIQHDNHT